MQLLTITFRTFFFYIFILVVYRMMGKREIRQLSVQDIVVSILIAEMAAISIENSDESIALTIFPIITLGILEILFAFLSLKFSKFRNIIEGKPVLIINQGVINFKEMVKQRYTLEDLLMELRTQKIRNIEDVEYAVLENSGKLSIFKYNFLKLKSDNPLPLILDGVIQRDTLKYLKKDEKWLMALIKNEGYNIEDIFYCFNKKDKAFIITKDSIK